MTYIRKIIQIIGTVEVGAPIYIEDIARQFERDYNLDRNKSKAAASVAIKRIIDQELYSNLRFYQKGVYYTTKKTAFGETGINKERLIEKKYLHPDNGYETGHAVLYRMGLTTQIPSDRVIATNAATRCMREDKKLGVFIKPPKTEITHENKMYLQMLDAIDLVDKAPIDEENPYELLAHHAEKCGIQYDKLLAMADRYYNKATIIQIAHMASVGGII